MRQGEIWLVNFDPSVGHEMRKERPAVIISANSLIRYSNLISVMPITSNLDGCINDDIKIFKDGDNCLFTDSAVKVCQISSFDKNNVRFIKKVGVSNEYIVDQIKKYLKKHFDL